MATPRQRQFMRRARSKIIKAPYICPECGKIGDHYVKPTNETPYETWTCPPSDDKDEKKIEP